MKNKNQTLLKAGINGMLVMVMLIPTMLIQGLIRERLNRKSDVMQEVNQKWAGNQTISGPLIRIPYYKRQEITVKNTKTGNYKETQRVLTEIYLTPKNLKIESVIKPENRKIGISEAIVYQSENKISGSYENIKTALGDILEEDILWNKAELIIGISDLRGIKNLKQFKLKNKIYTFEGSKSLNPVMGNVIISQLNSNINSNESIPFEIDLNLNGSETLNYIPIGESNSFVARSTWPNPKFSGNFLPDSRNINDSGFVANWNISHLNRNLPQKWNEENFPSFIDSTLGLSLLNPNDNYQKTERSLKYSILIISLTFLAFFFLEMILKEKIHPLQYALVGAALCIFYTLLLSFSEILIFNYSYLISTLMTLLLITLYTRSLFKNTRMAYWIASILSVLYLFIFIIIQLEDTALLIGSLGLFFILSLTMYVSRKINWYTDENSDLINN